MKTSTLAFLFTSVITLCLQFGCSGTGAIEKAGPAITPDVIASSLMQSEALFNQRADFSKLREAVDVLRKARDYKQRNFEVEWKFAKLNYFLGKQSTDAKEANAAFEEGRDAAKIASGLQPQKPDGYFWYGANLGELARKNPITVGLKSVDEVKDAMQKVVDMQPLLNQTVSRQTPG